MAKFKDSKSDELSKFQQMYPRQFDAAGISALETEYTTAELKGLQIYNSDTNKMWFHNGTTWEVITSAV